MRIGIKGKFLIPTIALVISGMMLSIIVSYSNSSKSLQLAVAELDLFQNTLSDDAGKPDQRNPKDRKIKPKSLPSSPQPNVRQSSMKAGYMLEEPQIDLDDSEFGKY